MATILLVDDYPPTHRLLGFVLGQSGYAVVSAPDGFQAIERLAEMQIDLIITDLAMPKMDGLSLVEQIRSDARYASTPIIMLTASCRERDQMRATTVGVNAFLTKPIDSEELVRTVDQEMSRNLPEGLGLSSLVWRPSGA